jgi:hypothetical protein
MVHLRMRTETDSIVDGVAIPAVRYNYDYNNEVDRAVHLIRDPFDNMVARFHCGTSKLVLATPEELGVR